MKRLSILMLVLCTVAVAQKPKDITIEYDRFRDRTRVSTDLRSVSILNSKLNNTFVGLTVDAWHPGQKVSEPETIQLSFVHRNWSRLPRLFGDTLILMIDGERLQLSDVDCSGSSRNLEFAWAHLTMTDLNRIAAAKIVEGKLGSLEFRLKPEHQRGILALVNYFR